MANKDKWLPVVGYEEYYKVSDKGEVRSLDRIYFNKGSKCWNKTSGMTLLPGLRGKPALNGTRYEIVNLLSKTHSVHKIVMEAFVGPSNGLDINHKDGRKDNNNLSNLEYVTRRQNAIHAVKNCLTSNQKPVVMIGEDNHVIAVFPSAAKAAIFVDQKAGVNITKCCRQKRKKSSGYRWMYVDDACVKASEMGLW